MYEQRLPIEEWKAKKQAELKRNHCRTEICIAGSSAGRPAPWADYLYSRGRLGSHITSGNAALVLQTLPRGR